MLQEVAAVDEPRGGTRRVVTQGPAHLLREPPLATPRERRGLGGVVRERSRLRLRDPDGEQELP
eukprot:2152708-Heterocapsa_arctica.AAC.1